MDSPERALNVDSWSPDDLLAQTEWIRQLARVLITDEHLAEDAVQETLLAAISRPPRRAQNLRGWLAAVVRNVARRQHRTHERQRRLRRHAPVPVPVDDAGQAIERVTTYNRVVQAILALDEPYRSAIILRYFDGLAPREIASRTGVSAETARMRVKRGLMLVRARLRVTYGSRSAWVGALLAVVGGSRDLAPPTTGVGAIVGWRLLSLGSLGLAMCGIAIVLWPRDEPSSSPVEAPAASASRPSPGARPGVHSDTGRAAAVAMSPPTMPARPKPRPQADRVVVRVRGADGAPLADARVSLLDVDPPTRWIPTITRRADVRGDGWFVLDDLAIDREHLVEVRARGCGVERRRVRTGTEWDVRLTAGGALRGRVTRVDTGAPCVNATVVLLRDPATTWDADRTAVAEARTDEDGAFSLPQVLPGRYLAHVIPRCALGRQTERGGITIVAGVETTESFAVAPGIGLTGRVVDRQTGSPLDGASVLIHRGISLRTGADGRFAFGAAPLGVKTRLVITADGYRMRTTYFKGMPPKHDVGDIGLSPASRLRGRIVDSSGNAVAGASVRIFSRGLPERINRVARTDGDGSFSLDVPTRDASVPVRIETAGGEVFIRQVDVAPTLILVTLPGTGAIEGVVRDDGGKPIPEAFINLRRSTVGYRSIRTDANGYFRLDGVAVGDHRLDVIPREVFLTGEPGPAGQFGIDVRVSAHRATEVNVRLEAGATLDGRVVDDTGRPVGGAAVVALARREIVLVDATRPCNARRTTSDSDGSFRLHGIDPSVEHRLMVHAPGHAPVWFRASRENTARIVLRRTGRIVGTVAEGGSPARVFTVEIGVRRGRDWSLRRHEVVNADGRFCFDMPPGRYRVSAVTPGGRSRPVVATVVSGEDATLGHVDVEPAAILVGTVVAADGAPVRGGHVFVQHADRRRRLAELSEIDPKGRFVIDGLEPGTYSIRVVTGRGIQARRVVALAAGSLRLDIRAHAAGRVRIRVRDEKGAPISGASVPLWDEHGIVVNNPLSRAEIGKGGDASAALRAREVTGADGATAVRLVPLGRYIVRCRAEGFEPVEHTLTVDRPGIAVDVTITVRTRTPPRR